MIRGKLKYILLTALVGRALTLSGCGKIAETVIREVKTQRENQKEEQDITELLLGDCCEG